MHPDEIELLKLQVQYLEEALRKIANELVDAGMAEHTPTHNQMLSMGAWAYGLFPLLGLEDDVVIEEVTID